MKLSPRSAENFYESNLKAIANSLLKLQSHTLIAGLFLTCGIALFANLLHAASGLKILSPLILAILLGIGIRNSIGVPQICQPGIKFSLKRLLRLAVILLGLRLSLTELGTIGATGLGVVAIASFSTFCFTCWLGKRLGVAPKLTQLIAAGTSICGASAVVAANAAVESSEEEMTYAIAMVTALGTVAMLFYPVLPNLLQLSPETFGLWCGASIHEVAQVIAAAFQYGDLSGEMATISKLARVMFLVPMVLVLSVTAVRRNSQSRRVSLQQLPIPWFVVFFLVLTILNSLNWIPASPKAFLLQVNQFVLTVSLAAMGLETYLYKIKQVGLKPLYLAIASWLFIAGLSLLLIKAFLD